DTPKSICGWWSMNATTQLSGVRSPFSLSLGRFPLDELMHFSFLFWRRQVFEVDREVSSATSRSRTLLMQDECQHGTVTLKAHPVAIFVAVKLQIVLSHV